MRGRDVIVGLSCVFVALGLACDPAWDSCGTVVSCATGEALVGVRVSTGHQEAYTDPGGEYCLGDVGHQPKELDLEFDKRTYEPLQVTLTGDFGEICLDPDCSGGDCPPRADGGVSDGGP